MTDVPSTAGDPRVSFPRQHARTRRFTLGVPRAFTVSPDGRRVLFLRSARGDDPVTSLLSLSLDDGEERRLVDAAILGRDEGELPPAERARRERAREMAGGITAYATDTEVRLAAFALGGALHTVEVDSGTVVAHPATEGVFDPRPDPTGRRVAYVVGDGLYLLDLIGGPTAPGASRTLAVEPGVSWGRAEFAAAEEMGRGRGFWWSPDGSRLAVARVNEEAVPRWHIADPGSPWQEPVAHRYPAAGADNAEVRLAVLSVEGGRRVDVGWDRERLPYLARVSWGPGPLTLQVQSRDQRVSQVLVVDDETGATRCVRETTDDAWVELVPGAPAWAGSRLVTVEDLQAHGPDGSRALLLDGEPVTPPGLQVRSLVGVDERRVTFTATGADPTQLHVWHHDLDRGRTWSPTEQEAGVHAAAGTGTVTVLSSQTLSRPRMRVCLRQEVDGDVREHEVAVVSQTPTIRPRPRLLELGPRRLRAALLLPDDGEDRPLPVVLDPYGGPHVQRVVQAPNAYLTSQWLADQGFAVLVVDGRGSPGRGPAWEREVRHDLATGVLEDQVAALEEAAWLEPRLDLRRVGIRGWSFGGYLAALAVLRRPDLFRAGVAGAPVTDWRLYDTHYTERYLGHPDEHPEAYRVSSLVDADGELLGAAEEPERGWPRLLLIHGLADDNVVAAHALRLSGALLAAGRPHEFLPLSGVTHMTPQEVVAERLLTTQVDFLRRALG
jgi:dipeptidyl-peptidase 4